MKKLIWLFSFVLIVSCSKDKPEPYYEFSISNTTIDAASSAAHQQLPLTPDFIVNSLGEVRNGNEHFNLTKEELNQLNALMLYLSSTSIDVTYGIGNDTPGYAPIYEIKYWYKNMDNITWMTQDIEIPAELQSIWNWYTTIKEKYSN